jgi:hypothetical protein
MTDQSSTLFLSVEFGLEVSAEKTKYILRVYLVSRMQDRTIITINLDNKSF